MKLSDIISGPHQFNASQYEEIKKYFDNDIDKVKLLDNAGAPSPKMQLQMQLLLLLLLLDWCQLLIFSQLSYRLHLLKTYIMGATPISQVERDC